ncbi:hypothetical protein [Haloarcula montana]|uniref:hypothetical protein n=1 Tax=Haloarcula montana TaxID=3111776 RepID=UPI002D782619|nr:hypothetical protein [Haloarcula sp. GH36]
MNNPTDEASAQQRGAELGVAGIASLASVALALYYYYVRGDKQRGQFVGLWPATILGLAIYRRLGELRAVLQESRE